MKSIALLFSLLSAALSISAKQYTDIINYKSESFFESSASEDKIDIYYECQFSKSNPNMSFSATSDGIITMTEQKLCLIGVEVVWASDATVGQTLNVYNKEFTSINKLFDTNITGTPWVTLTCEEPGGTSTFTASDICYDFGMKAAVGKVSVSSIKFTWADELPVAQDPDTDKIDFLRDDFSAVQDTELDGVFYADEYLILSVDGSSSSAMLTSQGLSLNGELKIHSIDGYIIKDIEVSAGEVELIDDWTASIYTDDAQVKLTSLSAKLGYEMPVTTGYGSEIKVAGFPAEISLEHTGSQARFFYIFEESTPAKSDAPRMIRRALPEQTPENWTESTDGKISVNQSGTLHIYAANPAHTVLSDVKTSTVDVTTGIEEVIADEVVVGEYYSVQGVYLGNDVKSLSRGIYLLRKGDKVEKVIRR